MIKSHSGRTVKLFIKAREALTQETSHQIILLAAEPRSEVENLIFYLTELLSNWDVNESEREAIQAEKDQYPGQQESLYEEDLIMILAIKINSINAGDLINLYVQRNWTLRSQRLMLKPCKDLTLLSGQKVIKEELDQLQRKKA